MQNTKCKLPVGAKGISEIMEMRYEEILHWEHFKEVCEIFRTYNYGCSSKANVTNKLMEISLKCASNGLYHYSTGIDNAISYIRFL